MQHLTSIRIISRFLTTRTLSTTKKLDWMIQAELDAQASTKFKAMSSGSVNDVVMGKIIHDLDVERVGNTSKLETKLTQLIAKVNELLEKSAETPSGAKEYNEARKLAIDTRQSLIVQREVSGMTARVDGNQVVELAFPIPPPADT